MALPFMVHCVRNPVMRIAWVSLQPMQISCQSQPIKLTGTKNFILIYPHSLLQPFALNYASHSQAQSVLIIFSAALSYHYTSNNTQSQAQESILILILSHTNRNSYPLFCYKSRTELRFQLIFFLFLFAFLMDYAQLRIFLNQLCILCLLGIHLR